MADCAFKYRWRARWMWSGSMGWGLWLEASALNGWHEEHRTAPNLQHESENTEVKLNIIHDTKGMGKHMNKRTGMQQVWQWTVWHETNLIAMKLPMYVCALVSKTLLFYTHSYKTAVTSVIIHIFQLSDKCLNWTRIWLAASLIVLVCATVIVPDMTWMQARILKYFWGHTSTRQPEWLQSVYPSYFTCTEQIIR